MNDAAIVFLTLRAAICAVLIVIPLGITVAYLLDRMRGPFRLLCETIVALPLGLPPVAVGVLVLRALGKHGWLGRLTDAFDIDVLFTEKAVVLSMALMSFPLFVRTCRAAFLAVDGRYAQIASTLGRSSRDIFFRITLPLAWRGVLAGVLLALARALGEFGATIIVAGNIPGKTQTLSLAIYTQAELGHDDVAMRLIIITGAIVFVLIALHEWLLRNSRWSTR